MELKQRVVYSLMRAAARVGVRVRMPLKQASSLLQMAWFQEAREARGLTLDAIADLFGTSLRTVSTLHHRYRSDFFAPEQEVALRRAIAALVNHAPATEDRLRSAFPDVSAAQLAVALDDLVREGTLATEGDLFVRNPEAHEFFGADRAARIDGLNRQLDVLADTVWHRLVDDDAAARARTLVFRASPEDLAALVQDLEALVRERAIAADNAVDEAGEGIRVGVTFAATPLSEETP